MSATGGPRRVLIVDDDPDMRKLLSTLAGKAGLDAVAVATGSEANRALDEQAFDLILLDLFLEREDGRNLLGQWRASPRTAGIPIFVLSAAASNEVKTECFASGADGCFEKPLDPALLMAAITGRLARTSRADAFDAAAARPSTPAPRAGPVSALLVEDDPTVAAIVRHRLTRAGYGFRHAADADEAYQAVTEAPPDLVILDLKLPGQDGLEILSQLRARPDTRAIPVIMLTASADERDMARAFELGATDYLMKPFSPTELMLRVERHRRPA